MTRIAYVMVGSVMLFVAFAADAGSLTGHVTGNVDHLPWRKGKTTLGWASVRVWQGGKLLRHTRTHVDGSFHTDLPAGTYRVQLMRPAFVTQEHDVTIPDPGEAQLDACLDPDPDFGLIVQPRAGMSEFCVPGETITIECAAPADGKDWCAVLATDYLRVPLTIVDSQFGEKMVWQNSRPGRGLTLRVPTDTTPGVYALQVSYHDAEGKLHFAEQPVAVCVLKEYPSRVRTLTHKDWHFNWYVGREGAAGEVQADYFRAAAMLNALWISLGDDIGFEGDDHIAMFWHMLRHECRTPVFLAFGNHDAAVTEEGLHYYLGPPVQVRRVGPAIAIVRSFDLYQADWYMPEQQAKETASILAEESSRPETRVIFLAGHQRRWKPPGEHYPLPPSFKTFLDLKLARGPIDRDFERLFLHSFSAMTMHGWGGLHYTARIIDVDLAASKVRVSPEVILPSVSYSPANNGTAAEVTALLKARGATDPPPPEEYEGVAPGFTPPPAKEAMIPYKDLTDLTLRFVMPHGRYKTNLGKIIRQDDAGSVTLVEVHADASGEETKVTLQPTNQ